VKLTIHTFFAVLFCLVAMNQVSGQVRQTADQKESGASTNTPAPETVTTNEKPAESPIFIYLVDGRKLQVQEVNETNEGVWYRQGSVTTLIDRSRVSRIERPSDVKPRSDSEDQQENTRWTLANATKVQEFFLTKFGRPLPTSAVGQSSLHDRWGLDHRQGMDVGLHPDSAEGIALVAFLRAEKIPFMAFRSAIPGVATGPHIHVGYASHRK